jgi:hypothetical protein
MFTNMRCNALHFGIAILGVLSWGMPVFAVPTSQVVAEVASEAFAVIVLDEGPVLAFWQPATKSTSAPIMRAEYDAGKKSWLEPTSVAQEVPAMTGLSVIRLGDAGELFLFSSEAANGTANSVVLRRSADNGQMWSLPEQLYALDADAELGAALSLKDGTVALGVSSARAINVLSYTEGATKVVSTIEGANASRPVLLSHPEAGLAVYYTNARMPRRYMRQIGAQPQAVNLPSAITEEIPVRSAAIIALPDGRVLAATNDNVLHVGEMSLRFSYDGGRTWPHRRVLDENAPDAAPQLTTDDDGQYHVVYRRGETMRHTQVNDDWALANSRLETEPRIANLIRRGGAWRRRGEARRELPFADDSIMTHVRGRAAGADWDAASREPIANKLPGVETTITTPVVGQGERNWVGTQDGLYMQSGAAVPYQRHPSHGVDGPLATHIAGLAVDSKGTLWVATAAGLSACNAAGEWRPIRGREGLPWEELTCIAIDDADRIWLGSTRGMIHYRPEAEGRQWFYRAGPRYVPGDVVSAIAIVDGGRSVLVQTNEGLGRIDEVPRTLHSKAEYLESRFNERHRRLGLASYAFYEDENLETWINGTQASDGLWTSYHITSASLAYSETQLDNFRASAIRGMEAMYLLQNVTGIKGLVARSVAKVGTPDADQVAGQDSWRKAPDPNYIWRDDVSNDQIDGHYLAFYSFFEHVAQFDPNERARIEKQVRQVTDYILDNGYTIIDWNGEVTRWGHWEPEWVNDNPRHVAENGLSSLQMLSFLKTAYHITNDDKYLSHYRNLIGEHGYLSNLQLEKKLWPDTNNHSDDQLAAVAWYPILQTEHDPFIRGILLAAVRRHARIEEPERNAFFGMVHASAEPQSAAVEGALQTLREFTQDRRNYAMLNSHRTDIMIRPRLNRGRKPVSISVLPYDEQEFERWNQDPYELDREGNGLGEGSGESYLMPYWMARFHGVLAAPTN